MNCAACGGPSPNGKYCDGCDASGLAREVETGRCGPYEDLAAMPVGQLLDASLFAIVRAQAIFIQDLAKRVAELEEREVSARDIRERLAVLTEELVKRVLELEEDR